MPQLDVLQTGVDRNRAATSGHFSSSRILSPSNNSSRPAVSRVIRITNTESDNESGAYALVNNSNNNSSDIPSSRPQSHHADSYPGYSGVSAPPSSASFSPGEIGITMLGAASRNRNSNYQNSNNSDNSSRDRGANDANASTSSESFYGGGSGRSSGNNNNIRTTSLSDL